MATVSNSNVREREIVTMRGGFVAARDVLQLLWAIEARGASFNTTESGFAIMPPHGMITREDRAFLLAHLDEAERILKYVEDNAQSLYEASTATGLL